MQKDPLVGIVVLNYNGGADLLACLQSLRETAYPKKDIIVIDNASIDGSLTAAERDFPEAFFVRNPENRGFARGMNQGMRLAIARGASWCWIFNCDARADKEALPLLVEAGKKYSNAGALSPLIRDTKRKNIWFGKGEINFFRMRVVHQSPTQEDLSRDAYPSRFLTGCALFIRKETIERIGFLDEQFFLYYEDADYSLRMAAAGLSLLVVPRALVWHGEASQNNPQKTYFLVLSGLLFFRKHAPLPMRPYFFAYGTIRRVKNFFDRVWQKDRIASEVHRAYGDYFNEHTSSHFSRFR